MQKIESLVNQAANGQILRRGDMSEEQVIRAVRLHHRLLDGEGGGTVLKRSSKTNVTAIDWDGPPARRLCVKEFVRPAILRLVPAVIRHGPALRSWRAAQRLKERGIGGAEMRAVVWGRGVSSYLVMDHIDQAENLLAYVRRALGRTASPAWRRAFLRAAAQFLGRCYRAGVFHSDLKSSNVFVREGAAGAWDFILIDLAAVRVPWRVRVKDQRLNLAQLNASVPLEVTWSDRLRFVRALADGDAALAGRPALEAVARITRARRCLWAR